MKTAKVAIECINPDTKETGDFLFAGDSHRTPGSSLSPVFSDRYELHKWCVANGWKAEDRGYIKND